MKSTPCADCRPLLVELRFGLLDEADAARVDAHLAGCADCRAAAAAAERLHALATAAAKADFPAPSFVQPPPSTRTPNPATVGDVPGGLGRKSPRNPVTTVATAPVTPGALDNTPTVRGALVRWSVIAGLLLAVGGLVVPAAFDAAASLAARRGIESAVADRTRAEADTARLSAERTAIDQKSRADLAAVRTEHDAYVRRWLDAEATAVKVAAERPFTLTVRGPAAAAAGAPNEYEVLATRPDGSALPVAVDGVVTDDAGKELFTTTVPAGSALANLKLPASLWVNAPAGPLTLRVTATDPKTGAAGSVKESVKIRPPVYATFLSTDKPLYRPGETVLFRSVTLDRANFLPPPDARSVWFDVLDPSGAVLNGSARLTSTTPAALSADSGRYAELTGPDGKPVRGVGTGSVALPAALAGGVYTLRVREPGADNAAPAPNAVPLAVQSFNVLAYTPDRLNKTLEFDGKTYGPGDTVQAKFTLKDQDRPLNGAKLTVTLTANVGGKTEAREVASAPAATSGDGTAAVRFALPAGDLRNASLAVTVEYPGTVETITRPVPVASKTLTVEFFPEGGDLVIGVPNRVYVRATTATGKPADIRGAVVGNGKEVAAVRTLTDAEHPGANQGMGVFTLTPAAGVEYALRVDSPSGTVMPEGAFAFRLNGGIVRAPGYLLPAAKPDGLALSVPAGVVRPGEPLKVTLQSAGKGPRSVVVGAYLRGLPLAHARAALKPGEAKEVALDLGADQSGGVVRVTAFEEPDDAAGGREDLKPVAERLVFRRPARGLKLDFTARRPGDDGDVVKPFTPGERVELHVRGTNETGKPAPAVLFAAVSSQSVVTTADDKTLRAMPTHFLLTGEVQKPEQLEHADFLLTEHPKAGEALDLLLGTQGWRRFAEQAPARFRNSADAADAARLLASLGQGPVPASLSSAASGVFAESWPDYQALADRVDRAEVAVNTGSATAPVDQEIGKARARWSAAYGAEDARAAALAAVEGPRERRRSSWPALFTAVFSAGFTLLGIRRLSQNAPERRWLLRGGAGLVAVGLLLCLGAALPNGLPGWTFARDDDYRERWTANRTSDRRTMAGREDRTVLATDALEAGAARLEFDRLPKSSRPLAPAMPAAEPPGSAPAASRSAPEAKADAKPAGPLPESAGAKATSDAPAPVDFTEQAKKLVLNGAVPGAADPAGRPTSAATSPLAGPAATPSLETLTQSESQFETERAGRDRIDGRFGLARKPAGLGQVAVPGPQARLAESLGREWDRDPATAARLARAARPPVAQVVREYAHAATARDSGQPRTDFAETLLWKPVVVSGPDGRVTLPFDLSDAVTGYRVVLAGHTPDGRIGGATGVIEVRPAVEVDLRLPPEIGSSDAVDAPVVVTNGTTGPLTASVNVAVGGTNDPGLLPEFFVPANGGGRAVAAVVPAPGAASVSARVFLSARTADGTNRTDSVTRTMRVVPDGFPASGAASDLLDGKISAKLDLPPALVPGTLKARVTYYPNPMADALGGLAGMLREPHGCFEQTSSSNYPNLLVLDHLKETNTADPDTARQARDYLDKGYNRLVGFECPVSQTDRKEGFEWFGAPDRPHDALTAYGLVQFADMARVYPVDPVMFRRTQKFLLDRRDGLGGYKPGGPDGHSFGRVPPHVHAAYLTWALAEAGRLNAAPPDLTRELAYLKKLAADPASPASADPYFLALAASACLAQNDAVSARPMLRLLVPRQQPDGGITGATGTITQSGGNDLVTETTGLAALAWVAAADPEFTLPVQNAVKYLSTRRKEGGSFGGTQATVLALKALTAHARANRTPPEAGTLTVSVNGKVVRETPFSTAANGPVTVNIPATALDGKPADVLVTTTAKTPRPVSVEWSARTTQPASTAGCQVRLTTALAKTELTEGETVRLGVTVANAVDRAHGMAVAVVGLPAGLALPPDLKQLKALCERPTAGGEPVLSYFETRGREVVLYWRSLAPKQVIKLDLDLVAATPGRYTGPASRAYLYYDADAKAWVAPLTARVAAKE